MSRVSDGFWRDPKKTKRIRDKLPKSPLQSALAQLARQGTEKVECGVCGERIPVLASSTKTYTARIDDEDAHCTRVAQLVVVTCEKHRQPPFFRAFRALVALAPFDE